MDCYTSVQKRGTILLAPEILPDEAGFSGATWQAKEKEATADIDAGRVAAFADGDSFLADLDDHG